MIYGSCSIIYDLRCPVTHMKPAMFVLASQHSVSVLQVLPEWLIIVFLDIAVGME